MYICIDIFEIYILKCEKEVSVRIEVKKKQKKLRDYAILIQGIRKI